LLAAMELEPDAAEPLVLRRVIKRGGGRGRSSMIAR